MNGDIFCYIRLPFKYYHTLEQRFYRMEVNQYKISTSKNEKIYVMNLRDTKLAMAIYKF